jgi:hypothetical protein
MRSIAAGWDRFWFAPQSTAALGIVRIAYGLLILGWTISVLPDIGVWYSDAGVDPTWSGDDTSVTLLRWWDSPLAVAILWAIMLLAAVCLTVGARTRLAAILVFVALLSFHRRNPDVNNGGDILLRLLAFYLMLAPAGAALSYDRWRRQRETFWQSPARAPWALRLIQIQVTVLYLSSLFHKVRGELWSDGTAYGYIVQLTDVQRLPLPDFVADSLLLVNLLTFGTLAVELTLAVLVWNRRALPWVMAAGVALHLGIEITMALGFFALVAMVSYLSFIPPDVADRLVAWVRGRWEARRRISLRPKVTAA